MTFDETKVVRNEAAGARGQFDTKLHSEPEALLLSTSEPTVSELRAIASLSFLVNKREPESPRNLIQLIGDGERTRVLATDQYLLVDFTVGSLTTERGSVSAKEAREAVRNGEPLPVGPEAQAPKFQILADRLGSAEPMPFRAFALNPGLLGKVGRIVLPATGKTSDTWVMNKVGEHAALLTTPDDESIRVWLSGWRGREQPDNSDPVLNEVTEIRVSPREMRELDKIADGGFPVTLTATDAGEAYVLPSRAHPGHDEQSA